MRVILDTNILISALLVQSGIPGAIYDAWTEGGFTLLTCERQLEELRQTLRKPALAKRIRPHQAGRLVNDLKRYAETVDPLPHVERSPDPQDDFLLAAAEAGGADYLVTGTKAGCWRSSDMKEQRLLLPGSSRRSLAEPCRLDSGARDGGEGFCQVEMNRSAGKREGSGIGFMEA